MIFIKEYCISYLFAIFNEMIVFITIAGDIHSVYSEQLQS